MEPDNSQTRCRPTIDLIKAENQLIHYYHQARGDDLLRQRLKVMDPAKIEIGGIIIGRSRDRLNRGGNSQPDIERAVQSIEIRKKYLYAHQRIKILTWDTILEYLRPVP